MKQLERDIEETKVDLANVIQGRLLELETELAQLKSQPKANAEFIEKRRQESEDKRLADEVRKQESEAKRVAEAELRREAEEVKRIKKGQRVAEAELRRAAEEVKRIKKGQQVEITRLLNEVTMIGIKSTTERKKRAKLNREVFALISNHTISYA